MNSESKLYIIMRNDLVGLNPGKAMAQSAHAANQFIYNSNVYPSTQQKIPQIKQWENQSANLGFGTTIILSASKSEIYGIIPLAIAEGYLANFTFDPTYPIKDGNDFFHVNALTCAYIFIADGLYAYETETEINLKKFKLYP